MVGEGGRWRRDLGRGAFGVAGSPASLNLPAFPAARVPSPTRGSRLHRGQPGLASGKPYSLSPPVGSGPGWAARLPARRAGRGGSKVHLQKAKCLFNIPSCGLVISAAPGQLMVHEGRAKVRKLIDSSLGLGEIVLQAQSAASKQLSTVSRSAEAPGLENPAQ